MNIVQIEILIFSIVFLVLGVITYHALKRKNENQSQIVKPKNAVKEQTTIHISKPKGKPPVEIVVSAINLTLINIFLTSLKVVLACSPAIILLTLLVFYTWTIARWLN